ncbi:MAG: hypothetical protein BJ554DRAFT_1803 [Olpidium bornovanus]|uniref:Uncharacterized protein n=1 Tax=Olpidium bornovanus TaxID=278681 RepID=A0A8H8DMG6_9FUNG|nr:MAG: hypothetical protein BJ554DRAFT_1803 [Olpidium bornovanus]
MSKAKFNPNAAEFVPSFPVQSLVVPAAANDGIHGARTTAVQGGLAIQGCGATGDERNAFDKEEPWWEEGHCVESGLGGVGNVPDSEHEAAYDYFDEEGEEEFMTPAQILSTILPHLPAEIIEQQLQAHDGDLAAAIASFLATLATPLPKKAQGDEFLAPTQTCRFFKAGYCARGKDCHFVHDVATAGVCTFWLKGCCIKGSACEFRHSFDEKSVEAIADRFAALNTSASAKAEPPSPPAVGDDASFPSLRPGFEAPAQRAVRTPRRRLATRADVMSERDFPTLQQAITRASQKRNRTRSADDAGPPTSFAQVAEEARLRDGGRVARPILRTTGSVVTPRPSKMTTITSGSRSKQIRRVQPVSLPWASTGSGVSRIYQEARAEATKHARIRNRCFETARRLFLANDRAGARRYSEEGHFHNEEMHRLHRRAAQDIFAQRNRSGKNEAYLDLHALHVKEALEILDSQLRQIQREGSKSVAYVIIGTGHHTTATHAGKRTNTLAIAVTDYLDEGAYTYGDCSTDGLGGMLEIIW